MAFHHMVQFQKQKKKKIRPQFDMGQAKGKQAKTKETDGFPKSTRLETTREQRK